MLEDLSSYENLGTPSYFFILLRSLRDKRSDPWNSRNIRDLFFNKIIDGRSIFDGCIPLLITAGIVKVNEVDSISLDPNFEASLSSQNLMIDKFVEKLLTVLSEDKLFHSIFSTEYISYDIIHKSIQIDNSAFPFRYSCFKQLLLDFGIIKSHPTRQLNKFIFNSRFKKLFDKIILPEIRKRKVGIEELHLSLEQKQIYGEEAEKFVLQFETIRLNGLKKADWVAEYSISEGYDIASFESADSNDHDRFIEVKSFSDNPYFFWSRNEMDIARIKKVNYFLYLVDRKKINTHGYAPIIIQDPYTNVLQNTAVWAQRTEKIRFELKTVMK